MAKKTIQKNLNTFDGGQIVAVNHAVEIAEDIVSGYFKVSSSQWLRNRYDVKTLAQLSGPEIVFGPYAQLVRYHGKKFESQLGSDGFDFYKICLQDHAIIQALKDDEALALDPLMLYIMVHELIHIIRFGRFIQFFDVSGKERLAEEAVVHRSTVDILKKISISGMDNVFELYEKI